MSHLAHMNKYKSRLIEQGITNPETQNDLVGLAYVYSFIRLFSTIKLDEDSQVAFMMQTLGYWNEVVPVNGNKVAALVRQYSIQFRNASAEIKGPIAIVIGCDSGLANPTYNDSVEFEQLIDTLKTEAYHRYKETVRGA